MARMPSSPRVLITLLAALGTSTGAAGRQDAEQQRLDRILREMEALRQQNTELLQGMEDLKRQNRSLQGSVSELQAQSQERWLSEERAAEIRRVVEGVSKDAETRANLGTGKPTVGYAERGFFIATPDGTFRLNLGAQIQVRYSAGFYSDRDNNILNADPGAGANRGTAAPSQGSYKKTAAGFEVRRMKLDFFGHVVDPSWQYRIVLLYNQNNNAFSTPGGNNNGRAGFSTLGMEEAMIIKDLGEGWRLSIGQFKSPFLREEITSSRRQLAVERSLVDQMFSTKFTQGAMATWQDSHLVAEVMVNDGGSNGNTGSIAGFNNGISTGPNPANQGAGFAEWAVTGHLGWLVDGDWGIFRDMTSYVGDGQGVLLNAWFNWQRGGQQSNGNFAGSNNVPLNGNADGTFFTWSVDASWNLGGANLFGYFVMNTAYSIPASTTNPGGTINSYGAVVQGGYFILNDIELFGRWEWMGTQNRGFNDIPNGTTTGSANVFNAGRTNVFTVGFNWFLAGPEVKWTTDLGWSTDPVWFNNGIYGANIAGTAFRVEPKGGGDQVVLRSQLQLVF
jgi:hypothetical protein